MKFSKFCKSLKRYIQNASNICIVYHLPMWILMFPKCHHLCLKEKHQQAWEKYNIWRRRRGEKHNAEWNSKRQGSSSEVENSSFRTDPPCCSPKAGWLMTKMRKWTLKAVNWNIFKKRVVGWNHKQELNHLEKKAVRKIMECAGWKWTRKAIHLREKERSPGWVHSR